MHNYDGFVSENIYNQVDHLERQLPGELFIPTPGGSAPTPVSAPPYFSPPFPSWQYGPSGIRMCLYRNTYIWLRNGNSFWFYPTFVTRSGIIGYRWRGFGWTYHIINPRNVLSYIC